MANRFKEKGKKLTEKDLVAVETKLGFALPPDLRAHYLANNGGEPTRRYYRTKSGDEHSVSYFFTMRYPVDEDDTILEDNYIEVCKKRKILKPDLIPFTEDDGGDPYCIHRKTQKIYYFAMEHSDDPKRATQKVADSLPAFIDGMMTETQFYEDD